MEAAQVLMKLEVLAKTTSEQTIPLTFSKFFLFRLSNCDIRVKAGVHLKCTNNR